MKTVLKLPQEKTDECFKAVLEHGANSSLWLVVRYVMSLDAINLSFWLQSVQKNGSLYIHVYFTKSGFHPDPKRKGQYRRLATVHATRSESALPTSIHIQRWGSGNNHTILFASVSVLNKFKRRKFQKTKNLLTGETEADPEMIKVCVLMDVLA